MAVPLPLKRYSFFALKFAFPAFLAAFLLPGKLFAQAPVISYSSPYTFTLNVAGTLTPTSSNVAAPTGAYGSPVVLGTGLSFAQNGLALDAAGNMYINDQDSGGSGSVIEISADGTSTTTIGTGFSNQSSNVAVDKAGNVFVADQAQVWKIPASGSPVTYGTPVVINGNFTRPFAIAVDTSGNVYVSDMSAGGVYKMTNNGTNVVSVNNLLQQVTGLAVDATGNVYAVDIATEALYEIPVNSSPSSVPNLLAGGFNYPRGLALDAAGTSYIDDEGLGGIYAVPAGGGTPVAVVPGLSNLVGVAVDASYNLYGALQASGGINKFSPTGGYFISPALPAGLAFNATTGVISGTPAIASAAANYLVSAYNASGGTTATVNIAVAPPPVISYTTPQTYVTGSAITPLVPSSTGPAVTTPGYSNTPNTVSSGFGSPAGVARDAAGNLYVADKNNNDILKIPPGGGSPVTITVANLNAPMGVAVDQSGNIYVADSGNGVVKEISSDLSTFTFIGTGFTNPVNVAFDPTGNLFIADAGTGSNGVIYEIEKATGKQSTFVGGFTDLSGLATDAAGNVYATEESSGYLYKYTSRSNLSLTFATPFNFPTGVAVDPSGNIFVSAGNGSQVYELPGGTGAPVAVGSGFSFPAGLVTDGAGNVYVTDAGPEVLYELSPTGGYYISQPLPRGLKLNDTTGIISGTPKAVSAATNYTVTAYASGAVGTTAVNITVNAAQPPAISYAGPQTYTAGAAITALSPTNTGGPVATTGYSDNLVVQGSGFSNPMGTAVDSHGNIYVADVLNNLVKEIPAGGGTPVAIGGTSFNGPSAVAVDSTGNVYVADEGNAQIVEIPAGGGANVILGSGFTNPNGVAVDPSGNVFVIDEGTNALYEIPAGNGAPVTLAPANTFTEVTGVAVDAFDNVYIADGGSSTVYKYALSTGFPTTIGSFFDYPTGVAVDAAGNVYVADQGPNVIYRLPGGGSSQYTIVSELNNPQGISVDGFGNVYIADTDNNDVEELSPDGGYYINKSLPSGLAFNSLSGMISGTPLAASPATNYTITGYNTGGGSPAALSITVSLPPPPTLSYVSPQVFDINTTISPVIPTASNVQSPAYLSTPTSLGSGFTLPYGTAVDQAGNIYIADESSTQIIELLKAGGQSLLGTGLSSPVGLAVDKTGNVYVADAGDATVVEIPANGDPQSVIGSGFQSPSAVAVDSTGNVFVADLEGGGGVVYKITPNGTQTTFRSGFSYPDGIAIDASGNVYVADAGSGVHSRVYVLSPDGSTENHLSAHFDIATGVAIDPTGNVFISDGGTGNIVEYPAGSGTNAITISATGLTAPFGLSVDRAGNIYAADPAVDKVYQLTPAGGYFINNLLPSGLSLNATTGIISGTPTVFSPAKNYTVSAYDIAGSTSAIINIKVTSNIATLDSLLTNAGTLNPVFSSSVASYTDNVPNAITSISLRPVVTDTSARVKINGTAASSTVAYTMPLVVGTNTATVVVTAGDGVTTDTYTVSVVRAPSSNDNLSVLSLSPGLLSPTLTTGITTYTAIVNNNTSVITVTPTTADPTATMTVDGAVAASGATFGPINLNVGVNPILIVVTAQDGVTIQTYTVNVTRTAAANDNLATISPGTGTLSPAFSNSTTSYTVSVPLSQGTFTVSPTTADPNATVKVNGATVASGTSSPPITLSAGPNTITVTVTAANGITTKTTTITVTQTEAASAMLTALSSNAGGLVPVFSSNTTSYTIAVNNTVSTATITPTVSDPNDIVTVNGTAVNSGSPSGAVSLNVGNNAIPVVVTAPDGTTTLTYTVNISRAASGNDNLLMLQLSAGTLSPAFVSGTTSYTASVPAASPSITVTPTAAATGTAITVNGTTVTSGAASSPITLSAGPNTINIVVTAPNGISSKTYTITATPMVSSNAALGALAVSTGVLSPAFAASTTSYSVIVNNNTTSISITPTVTVSTSTVKVNGVAVTSGTASGSISLNVGVNAIPVVVTAEDGTTTQTYTVNVTRTAPANDNLIALGISNGTLSPVFSTATTSYAVTVPVSVSTVSITPTTADATATVTVNGSPVTSGAASSPITLSPGANTITVVVTAGNGISTKTYTVTVTQAASGNASLAALSVSTGSLTPAFNASTTNYNVTVNNITTSITITPTVALNTSTVKVNGVAVASGTASGSISLSVGNNAIPVVVTAGDGTTTQTYTVNVTRTGAANDNLIALTTSSGSLSPVFSTATTSYAVSVPASQSSITVTPTTADPTATIAVNGSPVTSGTASSAIALNPGPNVINVVVTAGNGITTKTYSVTVTPLASSNANLSALAVSTGTLTPAFVASTTSYNVIVNNVTTSIAITPTVAISTSTVKVNGTAVTSGTASGAISLNVGVNAIPVVVTAQNGTTTQTYTVNVTRTPSSNTNLLSLVRNPGDAPVPYNGIDTYSAAVPNTDASVTLTPNPADPAATITINGIAVTAGTASGSISLSVGANTIPMVVTAANGVTTKTYQIVITRAAGGANQYSTVGVIAPDGNIAIADDGIVVHRGVTPNGDGIEDYLQIDNISQYPDNRLMIMNRDGQLIYETKGYDNSTRVFDGHSNKTGQMQLPGTYFFALDYTVNGITKHKTGFLVLKY